MTPLRSRTSPGRVRFGAVLGAMLAALTVSTASSAQAPIEPNSVLPAGHPGADFTPPPDRNSPAPDLRPGNIEVLIHDGHEAALPSLPLELEILHNDVASGDSKSTRSAMTDAQGLAKFDGLPIGTAYSYRVAITRGAAKFSSEPLRLETTSGQRVLLHVYPSVSDIREALVGLRAVVFVQPREDVFHVETNFQVLNIGPVAWVPNDVHLTLPTGAKAFRVADSMSDQRFERPGTGDVELRGTFGPGQHEIGFQFEIDNPHEREKSLRLSLPPHVAELRVIAESTRGMVLHADGFPDAEPMQGQDGSRLLVTAKHLVRGDPAMASLEVTLTNLPVPSKGRWYAVFIALACALFGVLRTFGRRPERTPTITASEAKEAENLVLAELVQLERLRRDDRIGPKTYEATRRELLDAIARLDARVRA